MKLFLKVLALLVLLCCGVAGWAAYEGYTFLKTPPEQPGRECIFDVAPGDTMRAVAVKLEQQGLVSNELYFRLLARYKKWEHRMQAGRFALNSGWTPEQILDTLVNGQPILFRVTVREGLTWWQTAEVLENAGLVRAEDFREIIFDPAFLRHYGIPFDSAEGFLMPDTYLLKKADTPDKAQARAVAGRMVDTFWLKAAPLWPDGKKPDRETLRRWVTLASIVEKETAVRAERPRVAGVYANRLKRNMLLQADPTVIYGLGRHFDGNLRRRHLDDASNAYNTYQRPGLPPGPICSFGMTALAAAIVPEEHQFLYFVARTDGGEHAFSRTLAEHNRAVRAYLRNRRAAQ